MLFSARVLILHYETCYILSPFYACLDLAPYHLLFYLVHVRRNLVLHSRILLSVYVWLLHYTTICSVFLSPCIGTFYSQSFLSFCLFTSESCVMQPSSLSCCLYIYVHQNLLFTNCYLILLSVCIWILRHATFWSILLSLWIRT